MSVRPVEGWKVEVTESKIEPPVKTDEGEIDEAVTKITWSGGKIEPGQFQEFEVSMGFMPKDTDQLIFPATQTYSSGEVVKWADEPRADGTEPERPAPVLKLVPASGDGGHGAPASPTPASAASGGGRRWRPSRPSRRPGPTPPRGSWAPPGWWPAWPAR
ncbi:YcnI family copper-binding membrane protein [Thermocatellispora tengchongensis]|uniref:YcnI family copper-binding membrane protein n=1 Tax=Thermocatellispora tengchongensis TaxID=1073253 RepID=UPI0036320C71